MLALWLVTSHVVRPVAAAWAEPSIVVEAVHAAAADEEAHAIALLLRQALLRERRGVIAGLALQASGGLVAHGQVSLPPERASEVLTAMGWSHRVQGKLSRVGDLLLLELVAFDAQGRQVGVGMALGAFDFSLLVEQALQPLRRVVGTASALPHQSAAQLAVFARVEAHLLAQDAAAAAAELALAEPTIAAAFTTVREIARAVWSSPALAQDLRLELVGRFGLPGDIAAMATDDSPAARLARARANFALSDLAAAGAELAKVAPATRGYWEVAFELAGYQGDQLRRGLAFDKLVAAPTSIGAVLLASLPSRSLSPLQERLALAAALQLGRPARHAAAEIAMRMVASDIDRDRALPLIGPVHMRASDATLLRSALAEAAGQGHAHAGALLATITQAPPPGPAEALGASEVATDTSPPALPVTPGPPLGPVAAQFASLFDALQLAGLPGDCVVVGWLATESFWQLRRLDRAAVVADMRPAMPARLGLRLGQGEFHRDRLVDSQLAAYARAAQCQGALLLGATERGSDAQVEAFLFDASANTGTGFRLAMAGVSWFSLAWWRLAMLVLAVLAVALGARAIMRVRAHRRGAQARATITAPATAPRVATDIAAASLPTAPAAVERAAASAPPPSPASDIAERLRPTPRRTDGEDGYLTEGVMAVRAARASLQTATPDAAATEALKQDVPTVVAVASEGLVAKLAKREGAEPQTLLGRYRVIAEVGRGAVGVVYQAYDLVLERSVAIKTLSSSLRDNPQAAALFAQEAKSLAQLNHTNIVTIYDQAATNDETYLIMEFVAGVTMRELAKHSSPMAPLQALSYMEQLCEGLAYAHGKRIIHRDIKPANIFLARDGTVKLGDFGLARVVSQLAIAQTAVRGTPLYMAPEQVVGVNIDHRADIYAVGCTLYDLLVGHPPFIDGNAMFHHVNTMPPPPSAVVRALGREIDELVMPCLAKQPAERVQSAKDLQRHLRRLIKIYRKEARASNPPPSEAESPSWP